jgi:hypothetical protein
LPNFSAEIFKKLKQRPLFRHFKGYYH